MSEQTKSWLIVNKYKILIALLSFQLLLILFLFIYLNTMFYLNLEILQEINSEMHSRNKVLNNSFSHSIDIRAPLTESERIIGVTAFITVGFVIAILLFL